MSRSAARSARPPGARLLATALGLALAAAACGGSATPTPAASGVATAVPTPGPTVTPPVPVSPSSPATPVPSGDQAALYREIEDQVVAERGLPAKERLDPIVVSQDEARRLLTEDYRKDHPADEIAVAEETLKALGLLPANASLGDLYADMLGSQVAGFYLPETKQLYVVSLTGSIGATEKVTFAHEFTHAIQDQNFGLDSIEADAAGQGDRALGRLSLAEGDAYLLTALWMGKHLSPDELGELLQIDPEIMAQLERLPAILRETFLFPAQQGLVFVNGIWAKGGWEAVDRAYGRLPDSTEQILHPDKYEAGEKPVEVALDGAAVAKAMGPGWSATPEDVLGEFQFSVWLRENGVEALPAQDAAAGWGGDRLAFLQGPGGAYALAMSTAWDTADDAREFLAAAETAAGKVPGAARVERGAGSRSVRVLIASNAATLDRLAGVVAGR